MSVYKATYDLCIELFRFTKELNKDCKYTVGESLKKETIELLTLIFRANRRKVTSGDDGRVPSSLLHIPQNRYVLLFEP